MSMKNRFAGKCRSYLVFFRHIENLDLEAVMAKNEEKAKNKRKKMGLSPRPGLCCRAPSWLSSISCLWRSSP